jgi:inhibitor of KinA
LQYKPFGERSILIEWPQYISEKTLKSVLLYKNELENHYIKDNVYIKSAYNSILITYNVRINNFYDEILVLKTLSLSHKDELNTSCKLWKIPVCYDQSFGIDLEEISEGNNLSIPDIIERHSSKNYHVYFIGFLPGFLYLGGLDKRLHVPRKSNPRLKVAKGSVAIGGSQTGIYPAESPGGWNIIGNTPLDFFNVNNEDPCFAKAGDQIQFMSITKKEYNTIAEKIKTNTYQIENEIIND